MQTVRIRLRKPTRVFTFLCPEMEDPLKRGESCIVRSDRGLEFGICVLPPEPCPAGLEARLKMNVVRKATEADLDNYERIKQEEAKAKSICARKIDERRLKMKLIDVEYTFDKHKVIFYFTAADRVDFRQLVRDLAHDLKARIELRHIQVRDEAKLLGGLGVCGRELCCATWLAEFKPISMKMAKRQNLSLNPSKISGQCGRLLCCLEYENTLYDARKKKTTEAASLPEEQAADAENGDFREDAVFEAPAAASDRWVRETASLGVAFTDEGGLSNDLTPAALSEDAALPGAETGETSEPHPAAGTQGQPGAEHKSRRRRGRRRKKRKPEGAS